MQVGHPGLRQGIRRITAGSLEGWNRKQETLIINGGKECTFGVIPSVRTKMSKKAMDFTELAKERYSCRSLSEKPVEREKIEEIIRAGLVAPTAHNNQPYRIYVV